MAKYKTQRDDRQDRNVRDQFGRVWLATIDKRCGDFTGPVEPAGWDDPLRTPQKYLRPVKDEFNQFSFGTLEVRFKEWIADQRVSEKDWKQSLWEIGQQKYGVKFEPHKAEDDDWLMHLAGPKPWPSSALLQVAQTGKFPGLLGLRPLEAGESVALGLRPEDTEQAADAVAGLLAQLGDSDEGTGERQDAPATRPSAPAKKTSSYTEFVRTSIESGRARNVEEAAALWRERKQAAGAA